MSTSCGALPTLLDGVLLHGQDPIALKAAHLLLRTLSPKHKYSREMSSKHSLTNMLNELGFDGLRILSSRPSIEDVKGERFRLTEKLIEVRITAPSATLFLGHQLISVFYSSSLCRKTIACIQHMFVVMCMLI